MIIATYVCPKCNVKLTDRGEAGATFPPTQTCGRCGGQMPLAGTQEVPDKK